ncbi:MAG TPA: acyl-CoA desaturase [Pseudonocardiaceae bacterium]|nr:acyl-CoA desaturase [Pseudonocardiaceae bacterium]
MRRPPGGTMSPVITDDAEAVTKVPDGSEAPSDAMRGDFTELSRRIKQAGLLDLLPGYYIWKLSLNTVLFAAGLAAFFLVGRSWWQMVIAVYLGFCAGQCIFMWHDAGHKAMFRNKNLATAVGLVHANLVNGASYGWWVNHHNRHHSHPNHLEMDPDIGRRTIIFDLKQYASRRGYKKFVVRHQSVLFFVLLTLECLKMQRTAWQMIFNGSVRRPVLESAIIVARAAIYLTCLFVFLTPVQAICFLAIQQAVQGVYFGMLFAPNHKGMEVRDEDEERMTWLERQVLTSRNVRPSWYIDFLSGGLNYQIEHHLFPAMPQKNLPQCRMIVRDFCREYGIPYHEVGFWRSYREVASFLHTVSAPVRSGEIPAQPQRQAA